MHMMRAHSGLIAKPRSQRFIGKTFLVTGASSGLGQVIAEELAADAAHVVLAARRVDKLSSVSNSIIAAGGSASVAAMDIMDYGAVTAAVEGIVSEFGRLDGAFNNAGGGGAVGTVADIDVEEFKQAFNRNFIGTYHCLKAELQVMSVQGAGSIVNNISLLAKKIMPMMSHYCASKRAIMSLQESAALEVADKGIRVNSVSPGHARPSEALERFLEANPDAEAMLKSPQGRIVQGREVYAAVAFLLDEECSSSVTGADFEIAGGDNVPMKRMG